MTWLVSKASWKPKIKWKQETQESWVRSLSQKGLLEYSTPVFLPAKIWTQLSNEHTHKHKEKTRSGFYLGPIAGRGGLPLWFS